MKKRICAMLLAAALLLTLLPMTAAAETETDGTCGDNLTWHFDSSSKVLTISGEGDMDDYSDFYDWDLLFAESAAPWDSFKGNIREVVIEPGVTSISNGAFFCCVYMAKISISNTVTYIGASAFAHCVALKELEIPASVTTLAEELFPDCPELENIVVSPESDSFQSSDGVLYGKKDKKLIFCPQKKSGIYHVLAGTEAIANSAFSECSELTEVILPASLKTIGNYAFSGCKSLSEIVIPDSVEVIGGGAFECCGIRKAVVGSGVTEIRNRTFEFCGSLEYVTLGAVVTQIGDYAFNNCRSLKRINLSDGLTNISKNAFSNCGCLALKTLPDSVTHIGQDAFYGTGDYNNNNNWTDEVFYLGKCAIYARYTVGAEVTVQAGTRVLADGIFENRSNITTVTIPGSVKVIGSAAFWNTTSLTDVYYGGTEEMWNHIAVGTNNPCLSAATVHFLGEECAHDWVAEATAAPTCTEDGCTTYTCTVCGASKTEDIVSALGHDYVNGVCTRCGAEDPNYVPPVDPCEGYTDINRSAWYHTAADFVISRGLMGSTKTDKLTFEPNTKVSRAMVASILYRMAGSPAAEYRATFTDVPSGKWFTNAIEWAAQNGLASGKGNGKFDPNGNVTRQELAVFMKKMAEYLEKPTDSRDDLTSFADASKVPAWAKDYVAWAVSAGLISGKTSGGKTYLAPTDNATRAEFASIIMRFVQNIAES